MKRNEPEFALLGFFAFVGVLLICVFAMLMNVKRQQTEINKAKIEAVKEIIVHCKEGK